MVLLPLPHAFAMDLTAARAAELTGQSARSVSDVSLQLPSCLAAVCQEAPPRAARSMKDFGSASATNEDAGPAAKRSSSAPSNATAGSAPRSCSTADKPLFCGRFRARHVIPARKEPFCIHCEYDLTGLGDEHICPECGRHFNLRIIDEYRRDPHWFIQRYKQRNCVPPADAPFNAGAMRSRRRSRDGT